MPNWTFCLLEVTARTRKPRSKADKALTPDEHGRVSDLAAFMAAAVTPPEYDNASGDGVMPFDFEAFIPTPLELYNTEKAYHADPDAQAKQKADDAANIARHGFASWYDFHCDKWGTKWNACECSIDTDWKTKKAIAVTKTEHSVLYRFNTAWAPPLEVILAASQQWPKLKFEIDCEEEATMFNPFDALFKGGRQVRLTEREPDNDEEDGDE
jgi:hypothetical protein